jgi:hypothetical protein
MTTTFKVLLIFALIAPLTLLSQPQDSASVSAGTQASFSSVEKWEYCVLDRSMWYWYLTCKDLRLVDSLNTEKVRLYENLTGVQGSSLSDIQKAYEIKNVVLSECPAQLSLALADVKKQETRKKIWCTVSVVGIPISFGLGVVGTVYLLSR